MKGAFLWNELSQEMSKRADRKNHWSRAGGWCVSWQVKGKGPGGSGIWEPSLGFKTSGKLNLKRDGNLDNYR